MSPLTVTFRDDVPAVPDSPAAEAKAVNPPADTKTAGFQGGDTVIRVGDTPIGNYRELAAALARDPSAPLEVTVKRTAKDAKPEPAGKEPAATELTFEVPARPMRSLGLVMNMGPITAVQADSPAAAAGLKAGDVITAVDGQSLSAAKSADDWQPDTLPQRMQQAAAAGKSVALTVLRDGKPLESNSHAAGSQRVLFAPAGWIPRRRAVARHRLPDRQSSGSRCSRQSGRRSADQAGRHDRRCGILVSEEHRRRAAKSRSLSASPPIRRASCRHGFVGSSVAKNLPRPRQSILASGRRHAAVRAGRREAPAYHRAGRSKADQEALARRRHAACTSPIAVSCSIPSNASAAPRRLRSKSSTVGTKRPTRSAWSSASSRRSAPRCR